MPICVTDGNKNQLILSTDRQISEAPPHSASSAHHRVYNRHRATYSDIFNFRTSRFNKHLSGPILASTVSLLDTKQDK